MVKVVGQTVTISINKLAKNEDSDNPVFLDTETIQQLVEVVEQLVNDKSLVVEVHSEE